MEISQINILLKNLSENLCPIALKFFLVTFIKFCITFDWNEISKNPQARFISASDGDFVERNKSTKYKTLQELTLLKAI